MEIDACQTVARWLAESASAVAFTGAGISTESGIPDFRSPGGMADVVLHEPIGAALAAIDAELRKLIG